MKTIKLNQMAKKSVQVEEKDLELLKELNGKISLLLSQIGGYEAEKMILLNQLGQLQAESEENKKYLQKRLRTLL